MKYTFRSETVTVYLNADYRLVILSSNGTSLKDGKAVLTAVVRRISNGSTVQFDPSCFTWRRHELSENFTPVISDSIEITSEDLVEGSATFICEFSKQGLYWKDTANISISATSEGANAPYQRTIYILSAEKPVRPSGDASSLPSGWSLLPPPRTDNLPIWASVGYVSFDADNNPIYSEWSDPVEWTGQATPTIVQWQWGDSSKYPPDVTRSIIVVDGDVIVFSEGDDVWAFEADDDTGWLDHIPDMPDGKPYLWKREYNYQHTGDDDEWFYYPARGPEGLSGAYQSLGYIIVGTNSVIFAGLDEDKNPTLPTIHAFIEDISYYFKAITLTFTEKSDKYYLVATLGDNGIGELAGAYITYESDGTNARTVWKNSDTDEEIEDGFVLAEVRMNGASIKNAAVITPKRFKAYEDVNFMEILNSRDMDDINVAAEALGVERVFKRVAILDAFIDVLRSNEAFIKKLITENFRLEIDNTLIQMGLFPDDSGVNHAVFKTAHKNNEGEYVTVFQIDIDTGNVFLGEPNSTLSAPLTGFMYRASDQMIIGPGEKFKLGSNGNLSISNATVSGTVNATSGTMNNITITGNSEFSGEVNCDGLRVVPQTTQSLPAISLASRSTSQAIYIAKQIYDSLYDDGASTGYENIKRLNGRVFKCSTSGISNTRNISYIGIGFLDIGNMVAAVLFLDSQRRQIPVTALSGDLEMEGMSGNLPDYLMLISWGTFDSISGANDEDFDGIYYSNPYANIYITIDYDNVYINVQEDPPDIEKKSMSAGQLYIDKNGFVKAITLSEYFNNTGSLSINT